MSKRLALLGVVIGLWLTFPAERAYADTWLCNSQNSSSFSACIEAGYTAHGYDSHNNTSYWRAAVLSGGHNCTNYVGYMLNYNGDPGHNVLMGNAGEWDNTIALTTATQEKMIGAIQ